MNRVEGVRIDRKLFGVPIRKPVIVMEGKTEELDGHPLSDLVTTEISFENIKGPFRKGHEGRIVIGEAVPTLRIRRSYVSRPPLEQKYDLSGRKRVKHRVFPGCATVYTRITKL